MWAALEMPALATAIEFENRQQVITALTANADEARTAFPEKVSTDLRPIFASMPEPEFDPDRFEGLLP